jgi:L-fuconolactonase
MRIDAEVHFWKYAKTLQHPLIRENKTLQQHYLPEHIEQSLHRNGIDGCIAVAAEPAEVETRFLAELSLTHPSIRGVVGWLDLADPNASEKIQEFQQYPSIRGYRIKTAKNMLPAPELMELFLEKQYTLELSLDTTTDMNGLSKWLKSHPFQHFILEACGNPDTKRPPSAEWKTNIRELSKNQNLSCKVSGLFERGLWKSWAPADFYPFLEILFDAFSAERLLYASDWPFIQLSGLYVQWKSLLEKFMERYPAESGIPFFGENAERFYRL